MWTTEQKQQIRELWQAHRAQCGWFMRADFVPRADDELLTCLKRLEKHGDRETYVQARKLEKCR